MVDMTTRAKPHWFVVVLPGESVDLSELYGPFRNEAQADKMCAAWNTVNATSGNSATVLPIFAAVYLEDAR